MAKSVSYASCITTRNQYQSRFFPEHLNCYRLESYVITYSLPHLFQIKDKKTYMYPTIELPYVCILYRYRFKTPPSAGLRLFILHSFYLSSQNALTVYFYVIYSH